jgi:transposase
MGARRRFSEEYIHDAVATMGATGVRLRQIAEDLGIGANILGRRRRELRQTPAQTFEGYGLKCERICLSTSSAGTIPGSAGD